MKQRRQNRQQRSQSNRQGVGDFHHQSSPYSQEYSWSKQRSPYYTQHGADSSYQQSQDLWESSPTRGWSDRIDIYDRKESRSYAGKGPKGYKRSDERIKEEVCEALAHHPDIDPSEVEVDVKEGVVLLSGTTESRQAKSMVEDLAESIKGVNDVKNDIRIMAKEGFSKNRFSESTISDAAGEQSRTSSAMNMKNQQGTKSISSSTGKSLQ